MADQISGTSDGETSINFAQYQGDVNVLKDMSVPQTIKVNDNGDMSSFGGNKGGFEGTSMTVPERIVLDGESGSDGRSDFTRDLRGDEVNLDTYMGGMATPPRTLTVDDTTSRYPGGTNGAGLLENHKSSGQMQKNTIGNAVSNVGRLFQESIHAGENDSDLKENFKMQSEIVRLNSRVTWLEKKVEQKESNSFWKTTLVCLLTIINPIIIHWLFNRRH